jgi:urease accessory protein
MLTLTRRLPPNPDTPVRFTLALTAEDRVRSRHYFEIDGGQSLYLQLSRGTVLQDGDLLQAESEDCIVRIVAKPEPVMTAIAPTILLLLRAAYHLGNRHVVLEVTELYLRFSPDQVLKTLLEQMGLQVQEEIAPFQPEAGAYDQNNYHHH